MEIRLCWHAECRILQDRSAKQAEAFFFPHVVFHRIFCYLLLVRETAETTPLKWGENIAVCVFAFSGDFPFLTSTAVVCLCIWWYKFPIPGVIPLWFSGLKAPANLLTMRLERVLWTETLKMDDIVYGFLWRGEVKEEGATAPRLSWIFFCASSSSVWCLLSLFLCFWFTK